MIDSPIIPHSSDIMDSPVTHADFHVDYCPVKVLAVIYHAEKSSMGAKGSTYCPPSNAK